jgi:hypothetical protein
VEHCVRERSSIVVRKRDEDVDVNGRAHRSWVRKHRATISEELSSF